MGAHGKLSARCRWPAATPAVRLHGEVKDFCFLISFLKVQQELHTSAAARKGPTGAFLFFRQNVESLADHTGEDGQGFSGDFDNPASGDPRDALLQGEGVRGTSPQPAREGVHPASAQMASFSPRLCLPTGLEGPGGPTCRTFLSDSAHSLPGQ